MVEVDYSTNTMRTWIDAPYTGQRLLKPVYYTKFGGVCDAKPLPPAATQLPRGQSEDCLRLHIFF